MEDYGKKAAENFRNGYNCAQSVLLTFAKVVGLQDEDALKLASSFGGGMGRLREVCGAVSAMFMVAGFLRGYTTPNNDTIKAQHYEFIQNLAKKFKEKHGTIICRELLELEDETTSPIPSKRTEEYYTSRPCEQFIRTAAEIVVSDILSKTPDISCSSEN